MAAITFEDKETVVKVIMDMKFYLQRCRLPDEILIERATESIDILNNAVDEGE